MTDRPIKPLGAFPATRMRRNRQDDWTRRLVAESQLSADDLIWPVFVHGGADAAIDIPTLPSVSRLSIESLIDDVGEAKNLGIPMVAVFPAIEPEL